MKGRCFVEMDKNKQDKAWGDYEKFKRDYEKSLDENKTFSQLVVDIMKENNFTVEKLIEESGLSKATVNRLRSGEVKTWKGEIREYLPHLKTIIAFCIACDLHILRAITLLESIGYGFRRTSEVHFAYCHLIVNFRGDSIAKCNEELRKLQIDEEYHLGESIK